MVAVNRRYISWVGWVFYAASFAMIAGNGIFGFAFADWALTIPWAGIGGIFYDGTFQRLAMLIAGWINPVFLTAVATKLRGRHNGWFAALRIAVVVMIPSCWVVARHIGFFFREGFYAWVLGMLLVLFSDNIAAIRIRQPLHETPNLPQSH